MNSGTRARELLDRLARLDAMIDGHRATLGLLERERLALQTKIRATQGHKRQKSEAPE